MRPNDTWVADRANNPHHGNEVRQAAPDNPIEQIKARRVEYITSLLQENILHVMEKLSSEEVEKAFNGALKDESELISDERRLLQTVIARITLLTDGATTYIPKVKDYEAVLTTGEAATLLGKKIPTIKNYIKRNRLVGYFDGGKNLLPAWQFFDNRVVPGVDDVLTVFGENGVPAVRNFSTPLERLDGQSIIDVLRQGNLEQAVDAAEALVSVEC